LRSFSSSLPRAVDVLAGLQVQQLTCVELNFSDDAATDSYELSMALARLSNLQQLHLCDMIDGSLGAALTTLVQLPHLTLLRCDGGWPVSPVFESHQWCNVLARPLSLALQQLLAQPLPLKSLQLPDSDNYPLPVLNMALLTNLTELSAGLGEIAAATVLPAQLQRLQFNCCAGAHSMAPLTRLELKQLQHLSVRVDFDQPQLLLQLAQLPALTHLALQYDAYCKGLDPAAATASAWSLLPQLRELEIGHPAAMLPSQPQWEAILAGAAAATSLTKLTLDARMLTDELREEHDLVSDEDIDATLSYQAFSSEVAACARLAKLTCLQDLAVGGADPRLDDEFYKLNLVRGDALALTALTNLTRLVLLRAWHGVGTAVATALARNLQQLQSLDLGYCCLQLNGAEGFALLEAISRLRQLTQLSLSGNVGLTQHGLMQLTGLSRLDWAASSFRDEDDDTCRTDTEVTDEALAAFWAAVHAQRL
jgi:hypothetical protein